MVAELRAFGERNAELAGQIERAKGLGDDAEVARLHAEKDENFRRYMGEFGPEADTY